jgi:hypothetical protein
MVSLFKEAMTTLIAGGMKIQEIERGVSLETPVIEIEALKQEENGR